MLPKLNTLWVRGELSSLERICLASMAKLGHPVVLYSYDKISNVPKDVELRDARQVVSVDEIDRYRRDGKICYALFSDYFRYVLLEKKLGIWMDTDCYCFRPIVLPEHQYLAGYEINTIANAVLHLPFDSPILKDLLTACRAPTKSPYWLDARRRFVKQPSYLIRGKKWNLGAMGWGIVGPKALTYLVPKYSLQDKIQPMKTFYPLARAGSAKLFDPHPFMHLVDDPEIKSLHFYAKERKNEQPVPGSFFAWATENVADYL